MHVTIIGTGRVGRMTLMALVHEPWIEKLTLIDIKPGLARAVEEEVRHSLASTRIPMEVCSYEEDGAVQGVDIVLVTAGTPRDPNMNERTALTEMNALIIDEIARAVAPKNPGAKYVIVTNPVDAMATLFKKISKSDWVISTGTNLESQRFRSEVSKQLNIPITEVNGFAAGEHGKGAVFLWSTVMVNGLPIDEFLKKTGKTLDKKALEEKVKEISRQIIKASGGTRQGPATSFRDILRSIALNENKVLSIAAPYEVPDIPESVMVGIPRILGSELGQTLESFLEDGEKMAIKESARKIFQTYQQSLQSLE